MTEVKKINYRPDIDGLRGISIILVLLIHLGFSAFPGGFVGVDIFFVISGYLISNILLNTLSRGNTSLFEFYERRILRIVPALFCIIAFCLVVGYVLLTPGDYLQTGRSAMYALIGGSNFFFSNNTGYFDIASEFMPLLHTWSLGVEEQFYFLWPAVLAILYRLCKGNRYTIGIVILCGILLSFFLNLWQTASDPKASFFFPHTRAWELATGGLLVLLPPLVIGFKRHLLAEVIPFVGISLIIGAALTLSKSEPYPGSSAVFPVLGAALVIYKSNHRTLVSKFLAAPQLVFVGKISYSLYLWHWPIIVFWRLYTNSAQLTHVEAGIIATCSVFIAWISWRWVEQPFRLHRTEPRLKSIVVFRNAAAIGLMLAIFACLIIFSGGFPNRFSGGAKGLGDLNVMWKWHCPQFVSLGLISYFDPSISAVHCTVGANWHTAKTRAILWGDSNAEHLMPLLDIAGRQESVSIATVVPCPAILSQNLIKIYTPNTPYYNIRCGQVQASVISMLQKNTEVELVLLAARWSDLSDKLYSNQIDKRSTEYGLTMLSQGLADLLIRIPVRKQIVIFNDLPEIPVIDLVGCEFVKLGLPRSRGCDIDFGVTARKRLDSHQQASHEVLRNISMKYPNVTTYSPEDYLCDITNCLTSINDEFIYRDRAHIRRNLTESTNVKLVDLLQFRKLLRTAE